MQPEFVPRKRLTKEERAQEVKRLVKNSPAFLALSSVCEEVEKKMAEERNAMCNVYSTMDDFMKGRGRIQAYDSVYKFMHEALKKSLEDKNECKNRKPKA